MAEVRAVPGHNDVNSGNDDACVKISEDATTGEALVVASRDALVLDTIKSKVYTIFDQCFGTSFRQRWFHELGLLTETIYYSCTTLFFRQTIGEEYAGLLHGQRDKPANRHPSLTRRLIFLICHSFVPYLYTRLIKRAERVICKLGNQHAELKALLEYYLGTIKTIVEFAQKWHFSAFLMTGAFATLAQRMSRLQFMHEAANTTSSSSNTGTAPNEIDERGGSGGGAGDKTKTPKIITKKPSLAASAKYKWLGRLMFVCAAIQLYKRLRQLQSDKQRSLDEMILRLKQQQNNLHATTEKTLTTTANVRNPAMSQENVTGAVGKKRPICLLCLHETFKTSVTPCGHLFCWSCILEWAVKQSFCPACRQALPHLSRIVYLQNFDSTATASVHRKPDNGVLRPDAKQQHQEHVVDVSVHAAADDDISTQQSNNSNINILPTSDAFFGDFDAERLHNNSSGSSSTFVSAASTSAGINSIQVTVQQNSKPENGGKSSMAG